MKLSLTVFFSVICALVSAQTDTARGIQRDIFLHPCDGFTAYTLKKGEFVYNQSPFTLPLPSWAWWGITDRITAEFDLLPLVGGLFIEPHIPVPSINFRFKLRDQDGIKPALAFETMYQHLWRLQNQLDAPNLRIERESGNSWYNRLNMSWVIHSHVRIHFSVGATYTENLRINNNDTINFKGRFFKRTINPDVSLSVDWRPKPWLSLHLTPSYGTTFVFLDNIPRKYQICYGFRIAPFYKNRWGILRTFRAEFAGLYMYFPDAQNYVTNYFPVFPYFYWQWAIRPKNKQ